MLFHILRRHVHLHFLSGPSLEMPCGCLGPEALVLSALFVRGPCLAQITALLSFALDDGATFSVLTGFGTQEFRGALCQKAIFQCIFNRRALTNKEILLERVDGEQSWPSCPLSCVMLAKALSHAAACEGARRKDEMSFSAVGRSFRSWMECSTEHHNSSALV